MNMLQQLQRRIQDSKSQMSQFQLSVESKVQSMGSNIHELQIEQTNLHKAATSFQAEIQAELTTLRQANSQLTTRIDNLPADNLQTPVTSPRRKKSKDTPELETKAPSTPSHSLHTSDDNIDLGSDVDEDTVLNLDKVMEPADTTTEISFIVPTMMQPQEPASPASDS